MYKSVVIVFAFIALLLHVKCDTFVMGSARGSFAKVVEALQAVELIDSSNHWIGGNHKLVSMGNLLDTRVSDNSRLISLVLDIRLEAEVAGGRFIHILGRNEADLIVSKGMPTFDEWLRSFQLIYLDSDSKSVISDGYVTASQVDNPDALNERVRLLDAEMDDLLDTPPYLGFNSDVHCLGLRDLAIYKRLIVSDSEPVDSPASCSDDSVVAVSDMPGRFIVKLGSDGGVSWPLLRRVEADSVDQIQEWPYDLTPMSDIRTDVPLFAFGDLHGDKEAFLDNLLFSELIQISAVTSRPQWIGDTAVVVFTGDILDRGLDDIQIIIWIMELILQARAVGGHVELLLGNHEVWNLVGLFSMAHKDIDREQRKHFLAYTHLVGRFLRTRRAFLRIGKSVFVHGGISPSYNYDPNKTFRFDLDAMNNEVTNFLVNPTSGYSNLPSILSVDGPLCERLYSKPYPDSSGSLVDTCDLLKNALRQLDAVRMIVGHSAQDSGTVLERCYGRLLCIDLGVSKAMNMRQVKNRLGGIKIVGDTVYAHYPYGDFEIISDVLGLLDSDSSDDEDDVYMQYV
eukprot:Partr_v1_DN26463_c3_g1_i3_m24001 putative NA